MVHKRDGTVYIADMEVATDSRRRGYGSRLMRSIERRVCDKPRVLSLLSKPEAVEFWNRLGFASSHQVCGSDACWQWMAKPCSRKK